jgi:hypothetical protein
VGDAPPMKSIGWLFVTMSAVDWLTSATVAKFVPLSMGRKRKLLVRMRYAMIAEFSQGSVPMQLSKSKLTMPGDTS